MCDFLRLNIGLVICVKPSNKELTVLSFFIDRVLLSGHFSFDFYTKVNISNANTFEYTLFNIVVECLLTDSKFGMCSYDMIR